MEGKKEATSSSALADELFGSKEPSSPSSSSQLFDYIFPPLPKVHKREYISSEETKKNHDSTVKLGLSSHCLDNEDKSQNPKTDMSQYYQQEALPPCGLSSSLYYGGEDILPSPRKTKITPARRPTQHDNNGEEIGMALRGNWWQGEICCVSPRKNDSFNNSHYCFLDFRVAVLLRNHKPTRCK